MIEHITWADTNAKIKKVNAIADRVTPVVNALAVLISELREDLGHLQKQQKTGQIDELREDVETHKSYAQILFTEYRKLVGAVVTHPGVSPELSQLVLDILSKTLGASVMPLVEVRKGPSLYEALDTRTGPSAAHANSTLFRGYVDAEQDKSWRGLAEKP